MRLPFDWALRPATARPRVRDSSQLWPSRWATTAAQSVNTGARLIVTLVCAILLSPVLGSRKVRHFYEINDSRQQSDGSIHGSQGTLQDRVQLLVGQLDRVALHAAGLPGGRNDGRDGGRRDTKYR